MNKIKLAFPIQIYHENFSDKIIFDVLHDEIENFLNNHDIEKNNVWPEEIRTSFEYENPINLLDQECFSNLKKIIIKESEYYHSVFEKPQSLRIKTSWINLYDKNDYQFEHDHLGYNNCHISGIYYHETGDVGGELIFYNPHQSTHRTNMIFDVYEIRPKNGDLIIFPSFLRHRVNPNKSDLIRKSISFNVGTNEN